jgi:methyl-accepting chemotaxis protein
LTVHFEDEIMSFLRFGLKTRLYGGFGILVFCGLALAGFAAWELSAIATQVGKMSALADNASRALDVSHQLEIMRRATLHYTVDADEAALKERAAADAKTIELLQAAAKATLSEERRRTYNGLEASVGTLRAKNETLVGLSRQMQADRARLFTVGDEVTANLGKLVDAARAEMARDATRQPAARAAAEIESSILLVRVANWRFLATKDPKGPATFHANVDKALAAIAVMDRMELAESVRALLAPVKSALSAYATAFESLSTNLLKSSNLFDKDMVPQIVEMIAGIGGAEASLRTDSAATRQLTDETIVGTIRTQETVAGLALLLGGLIAFFVGRSIVRPVVGMTEAMDKLAGGDTRVEIPGRENTDQIGSMAKAVEVFKQNAIERIRLEDEQKQTELRAAEQRKAEMHKLAASFEAAVGSIVNNVSSAATELEAAATTLTHTAENTQQLSSVVASASEEASSNVQSVASCTEELTASVNEISRQVQESSRIAGEAVAQARQTDVRINELSQAAARIGDVVKLITAVAEQTNLLALNATIEAARAGEAGRGFAVVAAEVKTLAAQTAKATDEISAQIASMQTATDVSVTAIKEIGTTIGRISEIATTIASAVEEQGAATQEISRNVQQAASGTTQVAANIVEVNQGAGETGSASSQVLSSARALSTEGNKLKIEVDKFLATVRAA